MRVYKDSTIQDFISGHYGMSADGSRMDLDYYLYKPACIDSKEWVAREDKRATEFLEEMERAAEIIMQYRILLAKRYGELETELTKPVIKIQKQYVDYACKKMRYVIEIYDMSVESGAKLNMQRTYYDTADWRKARKFYADYVKSHPGIEEQNYL